MKTSDLILLDTNILVYVHQALSPFHARSKAILEKGIAGELSLCVCPQVLVEFYSAITNPKRVTNPVSAEQAIEEIEKYIKSKKILKIYPKKDTFLNTIGLLKKYKVKRTEVFDLQLAATMLSNGITQIYTFNQDDFHNVSEVEALEP